MEKSEGGRARQSWWTLRLWPRGRSEHITLTAAPAATDEPWRRMRGPLFTLLATMAFGTLGYMIIEGWSLTDAGRLFTSFLILVGVAGLSYTFTIVTGTLFEGHLTRQWERRRMTKLVDSLTDHYILCGYGRVGQQIARELLREGESVVVIDSDQHELDRATALGLAVVNGNATEDDTLRAAGIERAKGLITAVNGDADNTFITISAHALRPEMPIVARVVREEAAPKLRRAGATHVVSPYAIAGYQMAMLAARSATVSALDHLQHDADDLLVVEVRIHAAATLLGLRLTEVRERLPLGLTLLGLRRGSEMLAPPPEDVELVAGDILVACGTRRQIRALEQGCEGPR